MTEIRFYFYRTIAKSQHENKEETRFLRNSFFLSCSFFSNNDADDEKMVMRSMIDDDGSNFDTNILERTTATTVRR